MDNVPLENKVETANKALQKIHNSSQQTRLINILPPEQQNLVERPPKQTFSDMVKRNNKVLFGKGSHADAVRRTDNNHDHDGNQI